MRHTVRPTTRASAVAALGAAALALGACGGSSSGTTTTHTSAAAAVAPGTPGGTTGPTTTTPKKATPKASRLNARVAALRACLHKQGIAPPPGNGQLPPGTTRAQLSAALKKCGAGSSSSGGERAPNSRSAARLKQPAVRAALVAFAGCMRQHGVNVPPPNTSGHGPVFNAAGLDLTSPKFRAAQVACIPALRGALGARPGGASGAPPQTP